MAGTDVTVLRLRNSGGVNWLLYARLVLPLGMGAYLVIYSLIERHHAASTGTFIYVMVLGCCSLSLGLVLLPGVVRE